MQSEHLQQQPNKKPQEQTFPQVIQQGGPDFLSYNPTQTSQFPQHQQMHSFQTGPSTTAALPQEKPLHKHPEEKDLSHMYLKSMNYVDKNLLEKLHNSGMHSVQDILNRMATPQQRMHIEKHLGVDHAMLLHMAHRADFLRLHKCGDEYSDLLCHAGVRGLRDLARRNAEHLHERLLKEVDQKRQHRRPSLIEVQEWITEAHKYPVHVSEAGELPTHQD